MTDCVNTYYIDRHLRELEDREYQEMRFVDVLDRAFRCDYCGECHATLQEANVCCASDVTVLDEAYTCTYCGAISDCMDEVKGHYHDD